MKSQQEALSFLRRRPAVHQLCVGSFIQMPFEMGDGVLAVPLKPLGFADEVGYLATYANQIVGAPVDTAAVQRLLDDTRETLPVIALCLPLSVDAPAADLESLAAPRLERARMVLAWTSARDVTPIGMVIATVEKTFFRPLPPQHVNRQLLFGIGGTPDSFEQTLLRISAAASNDERFQFALSLYHDALKEPNARFRIARMFNVLEGLAYRIKAALPPRKAVKELLGLPDGATAEIHRNGARYRFDAIEIAGRVRDKLFHGVPFESNDLNVESRPAFDLFLAHPEDIASIVSDYCELELNRWANKKAEGRWRKEIMDERGV
jgi:hypothetical protein